MRSRNIKPGFFQNEYLVELEPQTRLLFIGLWCCADREGRLEDRPKKIKMQVFPADDYDVDGALTDLERSKLIARYEVDGSKYIQIYNFVKHQNPHHKESASTIPAPEGHSDSLNVPSEVTPGQRQRIFDRDGHKCLACSSTENLQVDHIVPVSMGGHSGDDNLQTLCAKCNASKGNRSCTDHRRPVNDPSKVPDAPLIPDSLIPDSLNLKPDKTNGHSVTAGFDRWWSEYPKKVKKKTALEIWRRKKPDPDTLIADVQNRLANDTDWRGGFIPHPTTYLTGERWNDELTTRSPPKKPPSSSGFGVFDD